MELTFAPARNCAPKNDSTSSRVAASSDLLTLRCQHNHGMAGGRKPESLGSRIVGTRNATIIQSLRRASEAWFVSFMVVQSSFAVSSSTFMDRVVFESVRKIFRHRPALFNWLGRERGGETIALKDVSFSAGRAEILVLLGPNGSGKTTALKLISTMLLPDAGSVLAPTEPSSMSSGVTPIVSASARSR